MIYLAPMEGITTYVFRNALAKYYGGIDRYYTPFLTASHLKGRELRDVCPENNQGLDVVPQILTNDPELFVIISEQLEAIGYKEVNLNLGCPSGTVVSKGRGAGMLDDTASLDRFLDSIFSKCSLKISVKTRIGVEFLSEWDDILKVYKKYPIHELIIHPRLRNEFYKGEVHKDAFDAAVNELKDIPLCYNGDITDIDSYNEVGYDVPVMIGRGLVMNPNLANDIKSGEKADFDRATFRKFHDELVENYMTEMSHEKQVVMKMKELWTYFSMGLQLDKKQLKEIHKVSRISEYKSVIQMMI